MFCPKCGRQNDDNAWKCVQCGEVLQQAAHPAQPQMAIPQTNQMAVWSMILGIASFICLWILGSIPAVILGHVSKSAIQKSQGRQSGEGMATAGIVLGYINLGLTVLYLIVVIAILGSRPFWD